MKVLSIVLSTFFSFAILLIAGFQLIGLMLISLSQKIAEASGSSETHLPAFEHKH